MTTTEFDRQGWVVGQQLADLAPQEQIVVGCRGSANPVALSWIAEALSFGESTTVVDLGAGLGGPAEWLSTRYQCNVIALEPAESAVRAAHTTFSAPVVQGYADAAPFAAGAFDAALLLGVLSVVPARGVALRDALRVARSLGVLDYCATDAATVVAGGSRFVPSAELLDEVSAAGWKVRQSAAVTVPAPSTWVSAQQSVSVPFDPSEHEVVEAIRCGALAPFMLVAGCE